MYPALDRNMIGMFCLPLQPLMRCMCPMSPLFRCCSCCSPALHPHQAFNAHAAPSHASPLRLPSPLAGWNVRSVACGPGHFAIAADQSTITWWVALGAQCSVRSAGVPSEAASLHRTQQTCTRAPTAAAHVPPLMYQHSARCARAAAHLATSSPAQPRACVFVCCQRSYLPAHFSHDSHTHTPAHRGAATNGELGYGPNGNKTSVNPAKVDALEGALTHQVACGVGFTLFLCDSDAPAVSSFGSAGGGGGYAPPLHWLYGHNNHALP
jgi:hypothetical protein